MHKKIEKMMVVILVAALLVFTGCSDSVTGKAYSIVGYFDTVTTFAVYFTTDESETVENARMEIEEMLARIESVASTQVDGSDVSKFNAAGAGEIVELTADGYTLFSAAQEMYKLTGGLYDPSVGLSVDLWGFTPRFNTLGYEPSEPYDRADPTEPPKEEYIEAFRSLIGFGDVTLSEKNGKYYATKPDRSAEIEGVIYTMAIDLGGIAKGYAADLASDIAVKKYGLDEYYVSVGRSSLVLGVCHESADGAKEGMWTVNYAHPRTSDNFVSVYASNVCAATSGDYERVYIRNSVRYCHIIDPRTGCPITNGCAAASVLCESATSADAWSTALAVAGKDESIKLVNSSSGLDALLCYEEDGELKLYTNLDESEYKIMANDVKLASSAKDGKIVVL